MSFTKTVAPSAAKARAIALPMPLPEPVIKETLFLSFKPIPPFI